MIRKLTVGLKWIDMNIEHFDPRHFASNPEILSIFTCQRERWPPYFPVRNPHIFNSGALCYRIYFRHTGVGNTWEHYRKSRRIWNFLYYFQKKYYYSIKMLGRIYFILLLYACSMNGCIKQLAKNKSICITTLNHLQNKFNNHSAQQKNPLWKCTQFPLNHRKTNIVMMKRIQLARVASA